MEEQAPKRPARISGAQKATLAVLGALVLFAVFVLPRMDTGVTLVEDPSAKPVAPPTANDVSPSTAAEKTKYRQDSQGLLARVVASRDRLLGAGVEQWARVEFEQALDHVESGDEEYHYGQYRESLDDYQKALTILENLEQQGQEKLAQAITDGFQAIESLNTVVANDSVTLAQAIAPQQADVQTLAGRVERLPELVTAMETGDTARARGDLQAARTAYQQAISVDPAHQRARSALASVTGDIADSGFRAQMSVGYAALEGRDYNGALAAFRKAGQMRPGNASVQQAIAQVENQKSQSAVSEQLRLAAGHEQREEWSQAVALYEALLEQDPSLSDARVRLIPAQVRAGLDKQLEEWIADPLSLAARKPYEKAQSTLADARGIPNPGPRLSGQITQVEEMLVDAVSPVNVVFRSDNHTRVTLFRVAELGQFDQTALTLRPGKYIAAGTRKGYRDVRVEFTITGKPLEEPIVVRCEEPI